MIVHGPRKSTRGSRKENEIAVRKEVHEKNSSIDAGLYSMSYWAYTDEFPFMFCELVYIRYKIVFVLKKLITNNQSQ